MMTAKEHNGKSKSSANFARFIGHKLTGNKLEGNTIPPESNHGNQDVETKPLTYIIYGSIIAAK
jgi:hypothetical protein